MRVVPPRDVVVVGAGSAGCVMAARLASWSSRSVLLLEAGPDLRGSPPEAMHDGWRTYRDSDWGYESEPDARGEVQPLFRGKVVGGSAWMTRFVMRGSSSDFDGWVRDGNPGWGFADTLAAFCRLENDLDFGHDEWHGKSGPLPVTRYPDVEYSAFESALAEACATSDIPLLDDHNQPGAQGAGRMPRNARDGVRGTSADGYLPADGSLPPNFEILPDSQVANVLVERDRAVGVRLTDGTVVEAGWVVLCAGTYGSPAILLRSGFGPADALRALGIDVRAHLPGVGENLADHQGFDVDTGYRGDVGTGPRFFWFAALGDIGLWIAEPFSIGDQSAVADVTAVLLTPRSRGSVRLRSADPAAPPVIRLPGLTEQADVDAMAEAARLAERVAHHEAIRRVCDEPAADLPRERSRLLEQITAEAWSFPHVVGTCAMGPSPDAGAVVDSALDVHGVAGLTVVDASVIPTAPTGFPHVLALMIAERAAERLASMS